MGKIPLGTPAVTLASVRQQIAEIEFLLEGRLDSDNLQREGNSVSKIGGGTVFGAADFARPIVADKLIADYYDETGVQIYPSFEDDIYLSLINKIAATPQIDVLEAKFAFDITDKPQGITSSNTNYVQQTGGMSSEESARNEFIQRKYEQYERERAAWRQRNMESGVSSNAGIPIGAAGSIGFAGAATAAGGPVGAAVGVAAVGLAALTTWLSSRNDTDPPPTISGISVLSADFIQTKYIKHPIGYKVCLWSDVYRFTVRESRRVPYADPSAPFLTSKISTKCKWGAGWTDLRTLFIVSKVDANTTAVTMIVGSAKGALTEFTSEEYVTILCDVDVAFKVLP